MKSTEEVLELIKDEVAKQGASEDTEWTDSDWCALVTAYIGRSCSISRRNNAENQDAYANFIKAAAVCVSALKQMKPKEN
jgi:hypothetical protein